MIDEYHTLLEKEFTIKVSNDNIPFIDEDNPVIQTESNPNPTVLKEITMILGLDYESLFQSREPFFNGELLNPRHHIAHGRKRPMEYKAYVEVHDYILGIMDDYLNAILNEAKAKSYLAQTLVQEEAVFNAALI